MFNLHTDSGKLTQPNKKLKNHALKSAPPAKAIRILEEISNNVSANAKLTPSGKFYPFRLYFNDRNAIREPLDVSFVKADDDDEFAESLDSENKLGETDIALAADDEVELEYELVERNKRFNSNSKNAVFAKHRTLSHEQCELLAESQSARSYSFCESFVEDTNYETSFECLLSDKFYTSMFDFKTHLVEQTGCAVFAADELQNFELIGEQNSLPVLNFVKRIENVADDTQCARHCIQDSSSQFTCVAFEQCQTIVPEKPEPLNSCFLQAQRPTKANVIRENRQAPSQTTENKLKPNKASRNTKQVKCSLYSRKYKTKVSPKYYVTMIRY